MEKNLTLEDFINECSAEKLEPTEEKFIGWEPLLSILVYQGLKWLLPEIREWVKLGATTIALKRLELKKRLTDYALDKELDFPAAEKAAQVVADNINEENVQGIIQALEKA